MSVVVFTRHFPSISQTFVMQEVTSLARHGVPVAVLASKPDWPPGEKVPTDYIELKVPVNYFNMPSRMHERAISGVGIIVKSILSGKSSVLRGLNVIRFGVSAINLSLIHVLNTVAQMPRISTLHCHFGPIGVLGAQLKKLGLVERLVVTFHGYDLSRAVRKASTRRQYKVVFQEADVLLPVSEAGAEVLRALGAPRYKIQVNRLGVKIPNKTKLDYEGGRDSLRVLTVARLTEKKGLDIAIEAISILNERFKPDSLRYDIIGGGALQSSLKEQIGRLGLDDVVHLQGPKGSQEVMEFMKRADVFVLPSVTAESGDKEGIPVSLMEAMAHGVPVVSTWHSGIPELVEDSVSGFLVPERDTRALAEAIFVLLKDSNSRRRIGEAGRQKVTENFNNERQILELERYLGLRD